MVTAHSSLAGLSGEEQGAGWVAGWKVVGCRFKKRPRPANTCWTLWRFVDRKAAKTRVGQATHGTLTPDP